jgi:hypothetical protein
MEPCVRGCDASGRCEVIGEELLPAFEAECSVDRCSRLWFWRHALFRALPEDANSATRLSAIARASRGGTALPTCR